jgi:hypothetical protein
LDIEEAEHAKPIEVIEINLNDSMNVAEMFQQCQQGKARLLQPGPEAGDKEWRKPYAGGSMIQKKCSR